MSGPNLLYLGPDKAGSTWLAAALDSHPDIFVPSAKDLYFFDKEYSRGIAWYERHYRDATQQWRADISHDYLYSGMAARRIAAHLHSPRLIVCFREPVSRAVSAFLNLRRHGLAPPMFDDAIESIPELVSHGHYRRYVEMYLEYFPEEAFYFPVFDDLQRNPTAFAHGLFSWLGLGPVPVPTAPRLPAGTARNERLARIVKSGALRLRDAGFVSLVGTVKRASVVQAALYRTYRAGELPHIDEDLIGRLKSIFYSDVAFVSTLVKRDLLREWGYE